MVLSKNLRLSLSFVLVLTLLVSTSVIGVGVDDINTQPNSDAAVIEEPRAMGIDWKVTGEFHLTNRINNGCNWARPLWIGNHNVYIGVEAYGGNSIINNRQDIVMIKTSGYGEGILDGTLCVYNSTSGGTGSYDDGYYVELWYQYSDDKFYGKICDAANHDTIYSTGNIDANEFTVSDFAVGRCLGTNFKAVPIAYEGWVDNVEFQWSEDGSPGYENSNVYDFSDIDGFVKEDDQTYSDVYWDSLNEKINFRSDRQDPAGSGERLEQLLPLTLSNTEIPEPEPNDWMVSGEFHLTYRENEGSQIARPVWIGNSTEYVCVEVYGGSLSINDRQDTIILKTSGYGAGYLDGAMCVYYSSRGGTGAYDDGYYVEIWYQSSDNKFYGKICDAADHGVILASGNIVAKDFSFSDISVGRCVGTHYLGVHIRYEGWVDNVNFQWSDDGIAGYENSEIYNFDTDEGFAWTDNQTFSDAHWDSGNEYVFFNSNRRDPDGSAERLERALPIAITSRDLYDWMVSGEFHLTYRSNDGSELARPIWLGDDTNYVGVEVYGGNSAINDKQDTIILKTSGYGTGFLDGAMCVYQSSRGGTGSYNDGYYVEFWYESSENRLYGKICNAADHDVIYASGSILANDFALSDISVGRCIGTSYLGVFITYEGWVDDVVFQWSEEGTPGYENSVTYDFDTLDGFTKHDDQIFSDVYWNSGNENIFFNANRRDPVNSAERMERGLPILLTN